MKAVFAFAGSIIFITTAALTQEIVPLPPTSFDNCADYGNPDGQFTYKLCPDGSTYERQYTYWAIWSDYYSIQAANAPCLWNSDKRQWTCESTTIACTAAECR